jgi:glycosyltransferase involved in cell wall biosynthesis
VWPRRFAFVGRYVEIKGLSTLLSAYQRYRSWAACRKVDSEPWELHCYGAGPLTDKISAVAGVVNHGFLQPKDLPSALAEAGVFVLPSMKDPWGVALAEGAGSGLPLITSDEVSSGVDLVRHLYNGYVFPAGDEDRLFQGLRWAHEHYPELPDMGRRSLFYAGAYMPEVWTERYLEAVGAR